jgi:DNA polymerase III delta prime subunit
MKLAEILFQKAKADSLAHFYVLETHLGEAEAFTALTEFVHNFIRRYYHEVEGHKQLLTHLMDHPDVFVLGNLPGNESWEDKAFTVEESEKLNRFFEYRPVQSRRKFAVITEAHRVGVVVANKWLKLLEEPQGVSTIFLLNPRGHKLLDTVQSRAIHLRIEAPRQALDPSEWNALLEKLRTMNLAAFLEHYSKGERPLNYWLNQLVNWETEQFDQSASKQALEKLVRGLQEMDVFNQPAATKWTLFYSYLAEEVLPRVSR